MNDNDRSITAFTMLAHGLFHTYELSIPLFVVIWLEEFSTTAATLGLVVGVGYGFIGVCALPSGLLADRYDARTLIVASAIGMGIGFVLFSVASSVLLLGAAIVVWGIAASVYHPVGLSLISRGADDRGAVFAYHGVGGNVGTAFGPLAVVLLLAAFEWRSVVVLLVVPAAVVVVLGYRISFDETAAIDVRPDGGDEASPDDESPTGSGDENGNGAIETDESTNEAFDLRSVLTDSRALFTTGFTLAFLVVMLYGVYYRGLLTFLPETIAGLPLFEPVVVFGRTTEPAQYVYTGLLTIGILGQYAGGHVTDHVRTEYALLGTLGALAALAFVFLPASSAGLAPFLVVCALLGFCLYATAPIYQVLIAEYAPANVHGLSYGYTYLGMFGVGAGGAALAGVVLTYFDAGTLFVTLGGISVIASALVVVVLRLPRESGT